MSETTLTRSITRLVKRRGGFARKIHQGIHGGGFPDTVIGYRGVAMFWEIKLPGNKPTELQAETMNQMKKAGLRTFVVKSTDQAAKILDAIDRKKDG